MPTQFRRMLLKQRRDFLELSRSDIIKRLYEHGVDVTEGTIQNWEDGDTTPDATALPALATVLKCKVHEFYE